MLCKATAALLETDSHAHTLLYHKFGPSKINHTPHWGIHEVSKANKSRRTAAPASHDHTVETTYPTILVISWIPENNARIAKTTNRPKRKLIVLYS